MILNTKKKKWENRFHLEELTYIFWHCNCSIQTFLFARKSLKSISNKRIAYIFKIRHARANEEKWLCLFLMLLMIFFNFRTFWLQSQNQGTENWSWPTPIQDLASIAWICLQIRFPSKKMDPTGQTTSSVE